MLTIKTYIKHLKEDKNLSHYEISDALGVSVSMVSSYLNKDFSASLNVAIKVYIDTKIVLHPFSEDSLKYEINKGLEYEKVRRTRDFNN